MIYIGTTRYNTKTYKEKNEWLKRKKWRGCVYGLDKNLSQSVPPYEWMYVIEMINDKNQIGGIGYIKNEYNPKNRTKIYNEDHYNMFVYKSKYFIERATLIKEYPATIDYLEHTLFYGSTHMKRGIGITLLSYEQIMIGNGIEKSRCCSICHEVGHNKNYCLNKEKIKKKKYHKICSRCDQVITSRGHSVHCKAIQKNVNLLRLIVWFFNNLF
jgi:hypothetical protein